MRQRLRQDEREVQGVVTLPEATQLMVEPGLSTATRLRAMPRATFRGTQFGAGLTRLVPDKVAISRGYLLSSGCPSPKWGQESGGYGLTPLTKGSSEF